MSSQSVTEPIDSKEDMNLYKNEIQRVKLEMKTKDKKLQASDERIRILQKNLNEKQAEVEQYLLSIARKLTREIYSVITRI